MKKFLLGLSLLMLSSLAWAALPTVQQVEAAARAGRYTQAESMMSEVVAAKPESARAHYVYAELLAHNGNVAKASEETAKARQIDPNLAFTDPERFRAFEQSLQRAQNPPASSRVAPTQRAAPADAAAAPAAGPTTGSGIPGWVWLAGLIVVAIVLWRGFARSRAAGAASMAAAGGPANANPYNAGVNPGQQGYGPQAGSQAYGPNGAPAGRTGSGLLGTGLAVAGGVAGGMLIDQMLHRGHEGGGGSNVAGTADPGAFGLSSPGSGPNPLADQPLDFGQGGDNWDSGGGSVDLGGGSDGGGGGWD